MSSNTRSPQTILSKTSRNTKTSVFTFKDQINDDLTKTGSLFTFGHSKSCLKSSNPENSVKNSMEINTGVSFKGKSCFGFGLCKKLHAFRLKIKKILKSKLKWRNGKNFEDKREASSFKSKRKGDNWLDHGLGNSFDDTESYCSGSGELEGNLRRSSVLNVFYE